MSFTTGHGTPPDYSHWRERIWLPAVGKAGLAGTGFHDLRRANASTLMAEGVDVKADTIYAQAVPEADRAAADVLGRAFLRFVGREGGIRTRGLSFPNAARGNFALRRNIRNWR